MIDLSEFKYNCRLGNYDPHYWHFQSLNNDISQQYPDIVEILFEEASYVKREYYYGYGYISPEDKVKGYRQVKILFNNHELAKEYANRLLSEKVLLLINNEYHILENINNIKSFISDEYANVDGKKVYNHLVCYVEARFHKIRAATKMDLRELKLETLSRDGEVEL